MTRHAYVYEAEVELLADIDPRAVGAAVTVALCGHWEHVGPCLWPHNNQMAESQISEFRLQIGEPGLQSDDPRLPMRVFRTLFVCEPADEPVVREKIRTALLTSQQWRAHADRARAVAASEQELADSLLQVPRRPA